MMVRSFPNTGLFHKKYFFFYEVRDEGTVGRECLHSTYTKDSETFVAEKQISKADECRIISNLILPTEISSVSSTIGFDDYQEDIFRAGNSLLQFPFYCFDRLIISNDVIHSFDIDLFLSVQKVCHRLRMQCKCQSLIYASLSTLFRDHLFCKLLQLFE